MRCPFGGRGRRGGRKGGGGESAGILTEGNIFGGGAERVGERAAGFVPRRSVMGGGRGEWEREQPDSDLGDCSFYTFSCPRDKQQSPIASFASKKTNVV